MWKWIAGIGCLIAVFCATVLPVVSMHKELRRRLHMEAWLGVVPVNVSAAILDEIPLNSTQTDVQRRLIAKMSGGVLAISCETGADERSLDCELVRRRSPWELVEERYLFVFRFNSDQRLKQLNVTDRLMAEFWEQT